MVILVVAWFLSHSMVISQSFIVKSQTAHDSTWWYIIFQLLSILWIFWKYWYPFCNHCPALSLLGFAKGCRGLQQGHLSLWDVIHGSIFLLVTYSLFWITSDHLQSPRCHLIDCYQERWEVYREINLMPGTFHYLYRRLRYNHHGFRDPLHIFLMVFKHLC